MIYHLRQFWVSQILPFEAVLGASNDIPLEAVLGASNDIPFEAN